MTTIHLRSTRPQPPRLRAHAPLPLESSPTARLRQRLVLVALAALALAAARALGGCTTLDTCIDHCMARQPEPHRGAQYDECAVVCADEETGGEGEP